MINATVTRMKHKKLSYRRGTARRAVSWNRVNCCTTIRESAFKRASI